MEVKMRKRKTEKNTNNSQNTSFFYTLTGRATMFLILAVLSTFALYISGNFQQFLDSSQRFLLQWCSILTIILSLFSVTGFFQSIVMIILYKKLRFFIFTILYLITLAVTIVLFLLMYGITYLSVGL